jgi:U4/U6 small nuclear ribonucleoprotein PRP31
MSTLADELLQDFEDSGSDNGEQQDDGLFANEDGSHATNPPTLRANGESMELDGDEEEVGVDEEMGGLNDAGVDVEDEEETKAKVEKMDLGGVDDVRSVAKLMRTLEPVLEVSILSLSTHVI